MPPPGGTIINRQTFPRGGITESASSEENTPAQVIVATVGTTDPLSAFNQSGPNIFDDYLIVSRYETDYRRYMAGVTAVNPSVSTSLGAVGGVQIPKAAFFQLAAPTTLWYVNWTAGRWGDIPDVPDPNIAVSPGLGGANWVLMDVALETPRLEVDATGRKSYYRVSGTYVYGCISPSASPFLDICFPRAPMWDDIFTRKIPLTALQQNLTTANF